MFSSRIFKLFLFYVFLPTMLSFNVALAQELDHHVADLGPHSDVPVAIQNARWAMMRPYESTLTLRNMDTLFVTRTVGHSGAVHEISTEEAALGFNYEFQGNSYSPDEFLNRTFTNALLIIKHGKIVHESYLNNSSMQDRFMGWSMTKSIVSILVGIAFEKGLINSLDDDISSYLPELKAGAYHGVTIRQILAMRSGVDYEERYDFENPGIAARNHILALVKNVVRFVGVANTIKRAHQPGEVQAYKTIDTAVLGLLIERVSNRNLASFMAQYLWEPLGADSDGYFIMDGEPGVGREFAGAGFNATLRDFGRLGLMMLNNGKVGDNQIVSAAWVKESVRPVGPENKSYGPGGYGYQWWTVADSEAYSAIGLLGQYIYVDPETETIIVKLSFHPPGDDRLVSEEEFSFFSAVSKWKAE